MDNRTKETQDLINSLKNLLEQKLKPQFDNPYFKNNSFNNNLKWIYEDIRRCYLQFNTKLFFIVIFGPLKSGKSTFTNCLARLQVSPTGFGQETTRRPAIILKTNNERKIQQFFSKDAKINTLLTQITNKLKNKQQIPEDDKKQIQSEFNKIIDFIKGIVPSAEIENRFRIETYDFTPHNFTKYLIGELNEEPLISIIHCDTDSNILKHNIAIIDMPGLDGTITNWEHDPLHSWMVQRAETFIFIQSSIAALNIATKNFFSKIIHQKTTMPPIWIIFNEIDAQYWQDENTRKEQFKQYLEKAKERIRCILNETLPRNILSLNLGLAWDGIFYNNGKFQKLNDFFNFIM